ncbi:MAG: hypothetical protein ACJ8C4_07020 [Gemmataceae bacterium]
MDYSIERFFTGVGLLCIIGAIFGALHTLPENNLKDRMLEWFGWITATACGLFLICPFKFFPPGVWLVGHLDDVAAALLLAFSAMTAGCAHHARLARDKFRLALANCLPEAA